MRAKAVLKALLKKKRVVVNQWREDLVARGISAIPAKKIVKHMIAKY